MDEIRFANVGGKKRHPVTLLKIEELPFDIADALTGGESYASQTINYYRVQCAEYLQSKGIDPYQRHYVVMEKEIVPFVNGTHRTIDAMGLAAAIKERDKERGQSADFLAALVIHHIELATVARNQIAELGNGHGREDAVLDNCMLAQGYFHNIQLLWLQSTHAAGAGRIGPQNPYAPKRSKFESLVVRMFIGLRARRKLSKSGCYEIIAKHLKKRHGKRAPGIEAIKKWLKSREDLP